MTEFLNCLERAKREKKKLSEVLWDKRYFFIMKFSEYPVSQNRLLTTQTNLPVLIDVTLLHVVQLVGSVTCPCDSHEYYITDSLHTQALLSDLSLKNLPKIYATFNNDD